MSPLARSLLALACTALLRANCAQDQLYCSEYAKGHLTDDKVPLPKVYINASQGYIINYTPKDYCPPKKLVGILVQACDWYEMPEVYIGDDDLSIHMIRHNKHLKPDATLEIWEFCK